MTVRRPAGPLLRSTVAGVASRSIGMVAQGLLGLLSISALSRLLDPEDFGLIGITGVVLGFAAIFSQLGVAPALIQRADLTPEHVRVAYTLSTLMGALVALVAWVAAPAMADFFREPELAPVLRAVGLTYVVAGQSVVAHALLERRLAFARLMQVDLMGLLVGNLLATVVLAAMGWGVWALVGGSWVMYLVRGWLFWRYAPHPRRPLLARRPARELLSTGGGFTLARIFHYAAMQGDYFIVGRVLGADALGIYTRAYRLMMLPVTYFAGTLSRVLFPAMARLQTNRARLREAFLGATALVTLVATPVSALLLIAAPEVVRVLLGPRWDAVVDPFRVLAAGILFRASYPIGDALARGLGLMYRRSVRDALYAALVLGGSWVGLRYGLPGVAAGVLLAVAVNYVTAASMSLPLVDAGWREYARAQTAGVLLALVLAAAAAPTRMLLESRLPALPLLVVTSAAGALALAAVLLGRPQVIGEHARSSLREVTGALGDRGVPIAVARRLERFTGEPRPGAEA